MGTLALSCRLNGNDALVFSDILVSPFIGLSPADTVKLDQLFRRGHLQNGRYYLAGYPDRGPRAVMKIGFADDLTVYAKDISSREAAEAVYIERGRGLIGNILDVLRDRGGSRAKVAEVWWFHPSPAAEQEWHEFMENLAHQMNEQIFFASVEAGLKVGTLDFRKPRGSDVVTVTIELQGSGKRWWQFWK